ncbi:Blue-light-activated protein [Massilia sp. Bi118]|uniref:hybrid sensor histidine kinase/response regulator n=1 Tax=Massilia sp. Bi118 TaxID=2822346 RepID=UPI001DC3EE6E|nr:ATP-binding protein [Massilia sp. Bi118]CAH0281290.1 Blue-light-activated protein [Massilia sp. Bi118]
MTIRSRLVLLVLSVLLPALIAGGIAVAFVFDEERDAQERALSEAARVLSQLVDSELANSETFLHALSASPDLLAGNLERFYSQAKVLSNNGKNTIILSGLDGMQVMNTRLPWGASPRTINPRLLALRRAGDADGAIVSDLFFSPLGQRYDFAVQVPVRIDGELRYYMSRGMEAAEIQGLISRQGFPENWIASVVDRDGLVIARSRNFKENVGKSASGALLKAIRAGVTSGINDGKTLDGMRVKAFYHRAPKSQWSVILSVPSAELEAPARRVSLLLTVLIALILVSALILTRRYLRRILAPVWRLRDDAQRLGRGDPVAGFSSGLAELDTVSATLVQASAQLRGAQADMERRVAEAIEATERAQRALLRSQKLEALGRLTGGVAHDFNNVLQTLTAALQLVGLEANPEKLPSRLAVCKRAIDRATALVARLRAFGQTQDAYFEDTPLAEAIAAVLPMLENGLPADVRLETEIAPALGRVRIDLTQFELALLNLVMNARDALADKGTIMLRVFLQADSAQVASLPAGTYVRIDVVDTGVGMTPEVMAKATDPFFTTKAQDKGTGLGLPQAYGFAIQSRGTLFLASEPGQGTTVSLLLPQLAHQAVDVVPGPAASVAPTGAPPQLRATVLFVEDDPLVRESVVPILERHGATVLSAENAQEALRLLEDGTDIDILFSDVVMPGEMNGVALAQLVRQRYPAIAIVLATGYFNETIDLPGVKVLTKPYLTNDALKALAGACA